MKKSVFFLIISFLIVVFPSAGQGCSCTPPSGYSQCYEVNRYDDANVCGTLRYAITQANLNTGGTYIKFNLAANVGNEAVIQLQVVSPATKPDLPVITKKVMIDGTSNPSNVPVVVQGVSNNDGSVGFNFNAGSANSTVKGMRITLFSTGLYFGSAQNSAYVSNMLITNNYLYNCGWYCMFMEIFVSNISIFNNVFNGYKDYVTNTNVPHSVRARCIAIDPQVNFTLGNIFITNIQIGDGTVQNQNTFYTGSELGIYVRISQCNAVIKIDKISLKRNLVIPPSPGQGSPGFFQQYLYQGANYYACHFNNNKANPKVTRFDIPTSTLIGTSSPGDRIEVYYDYVNSSGGAWAAAAPKYLGVAIADAQGNWSLPKTSWEDTRQDVIPNTMFTVIADSLGNSSEYVSYRHIPCPVPDITGLPFIVCKNSAAFAITGTPAQGTFSSSPNPPSLSGTTTTTFNPALVTGYGTYTITYANFPVPAGRGCPTSITKKILIPPPAIFIDSVINISAGTSNDAWPVDASILPSTLTTPVGYGLSGIKFMWEPEHQYAYVDDRKQTNTLLTRTDGLLMNVPMFNWKNTASNSCYANWRKINTITQVNSGTGQLENKDILNNYSAALYGYNEKLATAVASNAQYEEICFDSFEEYGTGSDDLKLETIPKSNLTIVTKMPSVGALSKEINFYFEILEGVDNSIVVEYPYDYSLLMGKRLGVFGASVEDNTQKNIHGYYDILTCVPWTTPGTIKVTLGDFSYTGFWTGKVTVPYKISDAAPYAAKFDVPANANSIVAAFPAALQRKAHSGKKFLKITANTEIEQLSLHLKPLKKYYISAWVSTDDVDANTYADGTNRRIEVVFYNNAGGVITPVSPSDYMFTPSGLIIEGWQRLEGVMTVPAGAVRFTFKFITPTGKATYFDDIRFMPFDANMESYVYNTLDYKLVSVLDANNYATYYYYDEAGNLYLVKKETELGVQTLQEVYTHPTEIVKD